MSHSRPAALLTVLVALIAVLSGCTSSSPSSPSATSAPTLSTPSPTAAATTDCVVRSPEQTIIDTVFTNTAFLTFEPICPGDVNPGLAGPEVKAQFSEMVASELSHDGQPAMRILAGELKSGTGKEFVDTFLSYLSGQVGQEGPTRTLATEPDVLAGYPVTYFSSFVATEGYTYAEGPTVMIAFNVSVPGDDDRQHVFTLALLNLYEQGAGVDTYPLGEGNYTTPTDPGWIFFRTPSSSGYFDSCGIGPNGEIAGCNMTPIEAPEGMNETVVTPDAPAHYRYSETPTFVRDVDVLPEGHRLQNGGTRCAVGHQGTVTCAIAGDEHGFHVSHYAVLW